MISAHEAIKIILESSAPCDSEELPLQKALGRYLSQSLTAPVDLPSFDHSAMDGYAVRCGDTQETSPDHPISLKVVGTIAAGDTGAYDLPFASGSAYRIMTGAMIPSGADAVIPFEEICVGADRCVCPERKGEHIGSPVHIVRPVVAGSHVRKRGEDVRAGMPVLEKGTRIGSRTLALLAALGIREIAVLRMPRVTVVSTGSELIDNGASVDRPLQPGKVRNSNGPALVAALAEIGILAVSLVSSSDDEKILLSALKEACLADVVITIGGVSAGDFDHVPKILTALGAKILFHKVAIKPGKPMLFALWQRSDLSSRAPTGRGDPVGTPGLQRDCFAARHASLAASARNDSQVPIFALPGNPVSALMVFDRFVRPALLKMMGANRLFRPRMIAKAQERLLGSAGKEDYLRVLADYEKGIPVVRAAGRQSSANLAGLARANAVAILPSSREVCLPGEEVEVEFLGEVL